jgi:hypothetical protein
MIQFDKRLTIASQRLKSALWYQIGLYVDAKGTAEDFNATPQFIGALTELIYTQIGILTSILSPHPRQLTSHASEFRPRPRSFFQTCRPQSDQHRRCHAPHPTQRRARSFDKAGAGTDSGCGWERGKWCTAEEAGTAIWDGRCEREGESEAVRRSGVMANRAARAR